MEENIFNTIRHEYKIENCIIEKRNDSTDGNVYTIFDNQNKFIAKIYKQEEHTKSMINLHLFLIKNGFIVPNIVKNINGDYLFYETSKLSRMFRFSMKENELIIILDIVKLDKHFIYYLIELLKIIDMSKKNTEN